MCDCHADRRALDTYCLRCTRLVVIFECTHCMQTVHLVIFLPYKFIPEIETGTMTGKNILGRTKLSKCTQYGKYILLCHELTE